MESNVNRPKAVSAALSAASVALYSGCFISPPQANQAQNIQCSDLGRLHSAMREQVDFPEHGHGVDPGKWFKDLPPHPCLGRWAIATLSDPDDAGGGLRSVRAEYLWAVAFLCRDRCDDYRLRLHASLEANITKDLLRASVVAAALGFMGHPDSEPVLTRALLQRRSWLLSSIAARALRRLRFTTATNDNLLSLTVATHWSADVRVAAKEALGWGESPSGYDLVTRRLARSSTTFDADAKALEPIFGWPTPAFRVSRRGLVGPLKGQVKDPGAPGVLPCVDAGRSNWGSQNALKEVAPRPEREPPTVRGYPILGNGSTGTYRFGYVYVDDFDAVLHGPATIVFRANDAVEYVAEAPGKPLRARKLAGDRLLLQTDVTTFVIDSGGVVGVVCAESTSASSE